MLAESKSVVVGPRPCFPPVSTSGASPLLEATLIRLASASSIFMASSGRRGPFHTSSLSCPYRHICHRPPHLSSPYFKVCRLHLQSPFWQVAAHTWCSTRGQRVKGPNFRLPQHCRLPEDGWGGFGVLLQSLVR